MLNMLSRVYNRLCDKIEASTEHQLRMARKVDPQIPGLPRYIAIGSLFKAAKHERDSTLLAALRAQIARLERLSSR